MHLNLFVQLSIEQRYQNITTTIDLAYLIFYFIIKQLNFETQPVYAGSKPRMFQDRFGRLTLFLMPYVSSRWVTCVLQINSVILTHNKYNVQCEYIASQKKTFYKRIRGMEGSSLKINYVPLFLIRNQCKF